jgi:hypothetical protein
MSYLDVLRYTPGMCIFQKKIYAPVLPALVTGLFVISACASTGNSPEKITPPEGIPAAESSTAGSSQNEASAFRPLPILSQEFKIPLWESPPLGILPEKVQALTINLDLIDLSGTEQAAGEPAALQELFQKTFYRNQSPQDYARGQVRDLTDEYRAMGEEAQSYSRQRAESAALNWSFEERFETSVNSPRLLVISRTRSNYAGGAHPNHDKTYFVVDPEVAMLVRLSDIIRTEARPMLKVLMNRHLRIDKKLGLNDSLQRAGFFEDEAELTDNYFLSPQGLGFHWDPYEIAPYAEGFVEAVVPYGEIENYLSPEGQRLAREFAGK